jgi:hypothetical protein
MLFIGPHSTSTLVRIYSTVIDGTVIKKIKKLDPISLALIHRRTRRQVSGVLHDADEISAFLDECLEDLQLQVLDIGMFVFFLYWMVLLYQQYVRNFTKNM